MFVSLRIVSVTLGGCLLAAHAGCITPSTILEKKRPQLDTRLLEAQGYSIPPGGMPTQVTSGDGASEPHIVLEVRGEKRHLETIPVPMDRPVFVEDIVQQAALHDKLGRLAISIMRPTGPGTPPVRMELKTDDEGKATSIGSNYALLPGDHLVVLEDQRSVLERFINSQFGN